MGVTTEGTTAVATARELFSLLESTKLIVGLHPDQAAGSIAQAAIAMGIGFAVVPCCVYSAEFPKRTLLSGKRVTAHDDLVQWMKELHPEVKTCKMDFEGKNVRGWASSEGTCEARPATHPRD